MKRKTKTQEALDYIEKQYGIAVLQTEELKGSYFVVGHPDPVHTRYQLRAYARELCLLAMVHEINEQDGLSLQFNGNLPWHATIEDEQGGILDVTDLVRERSHLKLNIHDTSGPKAVVIDAFRFARALTATGVQAQYLSQTIDGTWFAKQPIVWASKRGFLHEWKHYMIRYHASPVSTVLLEGANELHRFDGQWVTLDRLTKLIPFA